MKALIIKKIADFFYAKIGSAIYEAKPRGSFKKDNKSIIVGDYVDISIIDEYNKKAVIEKIYDRKNMLQRPNIANISKIILVFSVKDPKLNISLIDKFLLITQKEKIDTVICFSKVDLDKKNEYKKVSQIYENIGYKVISYSTVLEIGKDELLYEIDDDITVIAGPSGAGKSSLINSLSTSFNQDTASISIKLQKGKNTTTYASLLEISDNSYIADTPGFSSLKLEDISKQELKDYFVEFKDFSTNCKFLNKCIHEYEPDCSIIKAVENGYIQKTRYQSYLKILNEIKSFEKRRKY